MKKIGLIITLLVLVITLVIVTVISSFTSDKKIDNPTQTTIENVPNNSTITTKISVDTNRLHDIKEISNVTNNLFKYEGIRIGEYDKDFNARIIWTKSIENISDKPQAVNIRIRFYDENQELVADYQQQTTEQEFDASNPFHLQPHDTNNASFTIYDDKLPEGKTLENIKYYSIEDINYE